MINASSPVYKTVALIVAAGRGLRLGAPLPKHYLPFRGSFILTHAIQPFLDHPRIEAVRVMIGEGDDELYHQSVAGFSSSKLLIPLVGGKERKDSVRLGLESLQEFAVAHVLIHDGARPCINQELISRVIEELPRHKGVIPAIEIVDTIKRGAYGMVQATIDRHNLFKAQTPQGFDYPTILSAHQSLRDVSGLTDDASLLVRLDMPVKIVAGDPGNIKITTPENLKGLFMSYSSSLPDVRVGHGIDVHAIGPGEGVMLLGIFIPVDFSLIGHSDADVGLHSLTDALLGAIGDGDIGQHFNPQDARWQGADSSLFIKDALRRVQEKGGHISHVDVTLMGERPKIAPYRQQMIAKIADLLNIDMGRVSVKATTTEKLGFTGREEGLAAFATATVIF